MPDTTRTSAVEQTAVRANRTGPLLEMRGIRKAFSGVEVLAGVDFALERGQVHALVGENGAGKSTLIKILGGVHRDYTGEIRIDGEPVRFRGPRDAERAGVAVIYQELALVPYLSVAENIFLGREPVGRLGLLDRRAMRTAARELLRGRLGTDMDVTWPIADLPIAAQQIVEIAKALSRDARILVMDEPTSALPDRDVARLFEIIAQLKQRGAGIIYISHKMDEIYRVADRITVLRDGQLIGSAPAHELDRARMIHWMVGRTIDQFFPRHSATPGEELLRLEDISVIDPASGRALVQKAGLAVRAGEIVGIAGLQGCGATELMGAAFGMHGRRAQGRVFVKGQTVRIRSPRDAVAARIAMLTNDRKASGLVLPMSVLHNLTLASMPECTRGGFLSRRLERRRSEPFIARMKLRAPSLGSEVATLSGGNQQKVVLAKWLMTGPRILLLDEPTRGIDVGAKQDIYGLMNELVAAGAGILFISSELPELLAMSDRVIVMHRGRVTTEFDRNEASQERVMLAAMGSVPDAGAPTVPP